MADHPAPRWLRVLLGAAILVGAASLLPAALTAALHCDESNVFRHVTNFGRGEFADPGRPGLLWALLTPVLLLPDLVARVQGFRLLSVAASFVTLAFVAGLAARPRGDEGAPTRAGTWGALLAVVLLATSGDWRAHAFEVRTDSYVVPLTLGAIALLLRPNPRRAQLVVGGLLFAAAGLVSQKSVFNVVAIGAGWALYLLVAARPLRPGRRLADVALVAAVTAGVMAAWFAVLGLITGAIGGVAESTVEIGMNTAFRAGVTMADKLDVLARCVNKGPVLWGAAALALPASIALARRVPRALAAGTVGLLMVGTIGVHSGFRVYYVASFEPYLALAVAGPCGLLLAWLHDRAHAAVPLLLIAGLGAGAWTVTAPHERALLATDNAHSMRVLRDVQALFPEPVPYWDGLAMVPGYPETTFLNTGSTRTRARKVFGSNTYIRLARERKPRFFVRTYMSRDKYMLPRERTWHWTHFLPLRRNIYVAGGHIKAAPGEELKGEVEILTAGEYRVWFLGGWTGTATVDGRPVHHRDVITLKEGRSTLASQASTGRGELWLILGADREPELKRSEQQVDWSFFVLDWRSRYGHYDRDSKFADLLTPRNDPDMSPGRWKGRRRNHSAFQRSRQQRGGGP